MAVGPCSVASNKASVTDNGYIYQVRSFALHSDTRMKNLAVSMSSYQFHLGIFGN